VVALLIENLERQIKKLVIIILISAGTSTSDLPSVPVASIAVDSSHITKQLINIHSQPTMSNSTMRSLLALLLFALSVSGADLEVSNWVVPPKANPYYPSMDAGVGDTILFTWPGKFGRVWFALIEEASGDDDCFPG
jgi:hypothetical protein